MSNTGPESRRESHVAKIGLIVAIVVALFGDNLARHFWTVVEPGNGAEFQSDMVVDPPVGGNEFAPPVDPPTSVIVTSNVTVPPNSPASRSGKSPIQTNPIPEPERDASFIVGKWRLSGETCAEALHIAINQSILEISEANNNLIYTAKITKIEDSEILLSDGSRMTLYPGELSHEQNGTKTDIFRRCG